MSKINETVTVVTKAIDAATVAIRDTFPDRTMEVSVEYGGVKITAKTGQGEFPVPGHFAIQ